MLDLHRLRVFRSVVATGSVQSAAASLGYTPSAVSQHLTALQRETGLTLLERIGRGLRPTAAGLALAGEADALLARLGETEAVIGDLRAGRTGSLSITYFPSVGAAWMPNVVRRLLTEFPGVRLDLRLSDLFPDDPDERSDLHLVVAKDGWEPGPGFTAHHLVRDPYVAVLDERHRLAGRAEIDLAELAEERWIDNDFAKGWCRANLVNACASAGFSPTFHVEAHDYPTAIAFVAAGIGITVMPSLGAIHLPEGLRVVPVVRPTPVRSIQALVRDAVASSRPAMRALELLCQVAEGEPLAA